MHERSSSLRALPWLAAVAILTVGVMWRIGLHGKPKVAQSTYDRVRELQRLPTRQGRPFNQSEFDELCRLASDRDWKVRCRAMSAMWRAPTPEQIPRAKEVMRAALKDRQSNAVRAYGVSGLGRIGNQDDVPYILPLLQDPEPIIREKVVTALERLGYKTR